jgi:hypothetical protein
MSRPVLVIDPRLGIAADELQARWNADSMASAYGSLERLDIGQRAFDPTLGTIALSIALGVATGVTANLLTDIIRRLLVDRVPAEELEIDIRRDTEGNEQFILRRKTSP